jgi:Leucine-rich repeat (LRR) protein
MTWSRLKHLQRLSLRQNEIAKFTENDVGSLKELISLDMYDNALTKTYGEALKGCTKLE